MIINLENGGSVFEQIYIIFVINDNEYFYNSTKLLSLILNEMTHRRIIIGIKSIFSNKN